MKINKSSISCRSLLSKFISVRIGALFYCLTFRLELARSSPNPEPIRLQNLPMPRYSAHYYRISKRSPNCRPVNAFPAASLPAAKSLRIAARISPHSPLVDFISQLIRPPSEKQ
jgi:hypothetical protein